MINAAPTKLDECFGYTGTGTYSGANIERAVIAASSANFFSYSSLPQLLPDTEAMPLLKAFAAVMQGKLDSTQYLRTSSLRLEGQDFVLVQRTCADYAGKLEAEKSLKFIFAIGAMDQGQFHILQWKKNVDDEDELVLGTVHLTSGRDFLITAVRDPESQSFRVYGIRDSKLAIVYSGGGSSC
jgi:hypothetical protein